MSETNLEFKQADKEDEKRKKLILMPVKRLIEIVDYGGTSDDWTEMFKLLIDFIIEKGYKIE